VLAWNSVLGDLALVESKKATCKNLPGHFQLAGVICKWKDRLRVPLKPHRAAVERPNIGWSVTTPRKAKILLVPGNLGEILQGAH